MLKLNIFRLKWTKISQFALYLLAFFVSFQTRLIITPGELAGEYFEYGTMSPYVADVLLFALFCLFIIYGFVAKNFQFFRQRRIRLGRTIFNFQLISNFKFLISNLYNKNRVFFALGVSLFLLILTSAISVVGAEDRMLAVYRLGWIFEGVFLFFLVVFLNYNTLRFFFFLGLGLSVQAGIAVWQFFSQSDFSSKWLGMALHKAEELGVSVIEVSNPGELPERWLRAYGALPHPNILGAVMAVAGLFCLYFLLSQCYLVFSPDKALEGKKGAPGIFSKQLPAIGLIFFFIALLASFSRSAWLGFIAGYAIIFIGAIFRKNLLARKVMLETTLILGLIFFAFFGLYGDLIAVRIKGEGRLENRSITERISSSKEAWEIIKLSPLIGVGVGNYSLAQLSSQRSEIRNQKLEIRNFYAWDFQPVHNAFLLIWAESGIFALSAFIVFLLSVVCLPAGEAGCLSASARRGRDGLSDYQADKNKVIAGMAIIVSLTIMMIFDHFWMSLHFGVLLSFLIPALTLRLALEN
jgi:O-antigen ligase